MKIIAGLGNPGSEYENTRHNAGFKVIDALSDEYDIPVKGFENHCLTGKGMIEGEKVFLIKPQTYMNLSGVGIRSVLDYYDKTPEDLIVIYDDIDLPPGKIRVRSKGSAGGHNGIKNIINQLGVSEFDRVKVGVGSKPPGGDLVNWVLGHFSKEDMPAMEKAFEDACKAVKDIIIEGADHAMNRYNG